MNTAPRMETQEESMGFNIPISKILLFLLLAGLSAIFLAMTFSYLYQKVVNDLTPVRPPLLFLFNTIILVGTSYFMNQANRHYREDNTQKYTQALILTFVVSFLFMGAQVVAWQLMVNNGQLISSDPATSYLYVISGLHIAHVVGGLPFLGYFIWVAKKRMKEPISVLIYFSDPSKLMNLKLLTLYWHFLDGLWIYLVLFFLALNLLG
ncbi:MAG: cytochrome c oxidase subunit 3 [Bacteroidota bacterium]